MINQNWQMIATIFIPTGLYAFKKIHKLQKGIILYGITFGFYCLLSVLPFAYWGLRSQNILEIGKDQVYFTFLTIMIISTIFSIVLPMHYINKWTKQFNLIQA